MWPGPVDSGFLKFFVQTRTPFMTAVLRAVSGPGATRTLAGVAVVAAFPLVVLHPFSYALMLVVTPVIGCVLMNVIESVADREMPPIPIRLVEIESPAFPTAVWD
ncbi:hypothetical protein [Tsukamurella soli]|uniref:Uncharacterized protein n=1 Tax=Tsukamurella soli TaxID=644556 RepID=A0ABP8KHP8_9ACTN